MKIGIIGTNSVEQWIIDSILFEAEVELVGIHLLNQEELKKISEANSTSPFLACQFLIDSVDSIIVTDNSTYSIKHCKYAAKQRKSILFTSLIFNDLQETSVLNNIIKESDSKIGLLECSYLNDILKKVKIDFSHPNFLGIEISTDSLELIIDLLHFGKNIFRSGIKKLNAVKSELSNEESHSAIIIEFMNGGLMTINYFITKHSSEIQGKAVEPQIIWEFKQENYTKSYPGIINIFKSKFKNQPKDLSLILETNKSYLDLLKKIN